MAVETVVGAGEGEAQKNRIQVSNTKKPLFFYAYLAKNALSFLPCEWAITTVVTSAEILENNGLAIEKSKNNAANVSPETASKYKE